MDIILAFLGSSALASLISGIFSLITNKKSTDDDIKAGLRILLYHQIKEFGRRAIAQGSISSDDLEDFLRMHQIYHDKLEGNGFLDDLVKKVTHLPVTY